MEDDERCAEQSHFSFSMFRVSLAKTKQKIPNKSALLLNSRIVLVTIHNQVLNKRETNQTWLKKNLHLRFST